MDLHAQNWLTPPPVLTTARLSLRPLAEVDPQVLTAAVNDFDISKWLTVVPFPYVLADAVDFIAANQAGALRTWAIYDATQFIGCIGADRELGYWLTKASWGQGFATEAGCAVLGHVFAQASVRNIGSSYFEGNVGSQNVLQKLGFVEFGKDTHHCVARNAKVPVRNMRLTRARWQSLNASSA